MKTSNSRKISERSGCYIPGGVSTSLRVLDPPLAFVRSSGAAIFDADGNEYTDYHMAFGALILGHRHLGVDRYVAEVMAELDLVGAGATELEAEVAERIARHVPSAEKVLFCNSGSEATYSAVRVARAYTGRRKIIKFQGCYHGWHDYLALNVASSPERLGGLDPLSAGALREAVENTIVLDFNALGQVESVLRGRGGEIAAIILEPILHTVGCVMPEPGFLEGLRELADKYGVVLIFDEVVTGFRHGLGGYQEICGVTPDLTTLGKSIANGYPCAAICGREDIMNRFNTRPGGDVFFAGTYNAHPLAMAAALATIRELEDGRVYEHIFRLGQMARQGLNEIAEALKVKAYTAGYGSLFVTYFMDPPISNYRDLLRNDGLLFMRYRKALLEHGIFMTQLNLRRSHVSAAHTEEDIKKLLDASSDVFEALKSG